MKDIWVENLVKNYSDSLFQYVAKHTDSKEDAEDIVQEVFLSCHKYKDKFDETKCGEHAWLYILAKNRLKNYYRDKKPVVSLEEQVSEPEVDVDYANQVVHMMTCRELTAKALQQLDPRSQKIIVLRFFQGKSHEEIADLMGLSTGNVRVIQSRALKVMEEFLRSKNINMEILL